MGGGETSLKKRNYVLELDVGQLCVRPLVSSIGFKYDGLWLLMIMNSFESL